jgi:hypothetical protein
MATSKAKEDRSGWWKPVALGTVLAVMISALSGFAAVEFNGMNRRLDSALVHLEDHQDRIVRLEARTDFQMSGRPVGTSRRLSTEQGTSSHVRRRHE